MADKKRINLVLVLLLLLFSILGQTSFVIADDNPDNVYWEHGFEPVGNVLGNNWISPLYKYQGKIIIGGRFEAAGTTLANNIVAWDPATSNWTPLGAGMDSPILALNEYHGALIAGGNFNTAGGVLTGCIAAWDGHSWSALGTGIHGQVRSIVVWNDKLWVGGHFDSVGGVKCSNIGMWDGSSWHSLGVGTSKSVTNDNAVYDLCVYRDKLIVAGLFDSVGGAPANYIAAWDGSSWSTLGAGTNGIVYSVVVYDSTMIVGGRFDHADGIVADHIAKWDGNSWRSFGLGTRSTVWELALFGDDLLVSGDFGTIDGFFARHIALYDGSQWKSIDTGITDPAYTVLEDSGRLIVTGHFRALSQFGGYFTLGTWDSTNGWKAEFGSGFNDQVFDIYPYNGSLAIGGAFTVADKQIFQKVTLLDSGQFSSVGNSPNSSIGYGSVFDFAEYNNKLIAAGQFESAGGQPASGIVGWDGTTWSPIAGLSPDANVECLETFGGELIAGGIFWIVHGLDTTMSLAAWDGSDWSSLGKFKSNTWLPVIHDLAIFNGRLIVTGSFDSVGGISATNVAAWDGNSWSAFGAGLTGGLNVAGHAIGEYNNQLILGGTFTTAGGVTVNNIAKWNGTSWSALGAGVVGHLNDDNIVDAMCMYNGMLIAGGAFITAGNIVANNIAAWDGTTWIPLGSGISQPLYIFSTGGGPARVRSLVAYNEKLFVGGDFTGAGDKLSCGLAVWSKGTPTGIGDDRPTELPDGYRLAQNYPNPFNPSTQIEYDLPTKSHVLVTIYNLLGQQVRTLVDKEQLAGSHTIVWDGRTNSGTKTATGMYLYRVEAGAFSQTKKMILLK